METGIPLNRRKNLTNKKIYEKLRIIGKRLIFVVINQRFRASIPGGNHAKTATVQSRQTVTVQSRRKPPSAEVDKA